MQELPPEIALRVTQYTQNYRYVYRFLFFSGEMSMDESTWSKDEYEGEPGQSASWLYAKKILWYTF
jgi:hypothetical protein